MELSENLFLFVILISAFGGLINAVIRIVNSVENNRFKWYLAFSWLLRDILAGIGAGIAVWLLNLAMNDDAGVLAASLIAGLAGVYAVNEIRLKYLYEQRVATATKELANENNLLPQFIQLANTMTKVADAEKKLTQDVQEIDIPLEHSDDDSRQKEANK